MYPYRYIGYGGLLADTVQRIWTNHVGICGEALLRRTIRDRCITPKVDALSPPLLSFPLFLSEASCNKSFNKTLRCTAEGSERLEPKTTNTLVRPSGRRV